MWFTYNKSDNDFQAWEAASQAVKDEEANKQKLCEDLNSLVLFLLYYYLCIFRLCEYFSNEILFIGSGKQ